MASNEIEIGDIVCHIKFGFIGIVTAVFLSIRVVEWDTKEHSKIATLSNLRLATDQEALQ